MKFHIITIFPEIFDSYFNESIIKRAQEKEKITINIYNLRDWTVDNHKTVDDTPYGGGAGMVMKIEPLYNALNDIKSQIKSSAQGGPAQKITKNRRAGNPKPNIKTILLSAKGKKWDQQMAQEYSQKYNDIILICGRYEGVDERITNFIDEEISVGDYVLTGGEIPTMLILDSITRLIPDVLGNNASITEESHSTPNILEYPQYTRPETFTVDKKEYKVPPILLSGDHGKIKKWRKKQQKKQ